MRFAEREALGSEIMNLLIPYVQLSHPDPLFNEFTYGDVRLRARQLKKLERGSYVFFHTSKHRKKYITAYYVVDRVLDTAEACRNRLIRNKYKNPHILESLHGVGFAEVGDDDAVLFGDPITSRVLEMPLLFDHKLADKLSLNIRFANDKSETQVVGSATRAWRKLTEADVTRLLDEIEAQEKCDYTYSLRSSEEVAETLERDIERYIVQNARLIGEGLKFLASQRRTDDGRLDVLFKDRNGNLVVVEIKLGRIGRDAVRQTKNYIRYLRDKEKKKVSGVIVCAGIMPAYEDELRKQAEIRILIHGWDLQVKPW